MSENEVMVPAPRAVGWYEETISLRGCKLSLENIAGVYRELSAINQGFGEKVIATLTRTPDFTDEDWEARKAFLLRDAFALTVSIRGQRDQQLYGEDESIFSSQNLPMPIKDIRFNNVTAWQRNAPNTFPPNRMEVVLDFGKPALLDPNLLVSEATPNMSHVTVNAQDIGFFRAVQHVVTSKILTRKTWYSVIHRSFSYDVGMWIILLPVALVMVTYYMEKWLPLGGDLEAYRWAFFIYAVGVSALFYRFLIAYTKWAFPVNILKDNKDTAWKHRVAIGGIVSSFTWQIYEVVKGYVLS